MAALSKGGAKRDMASSHIARRARPALLQDFFSPSQEGRSQSGFHSAHRATVFRLNDPSKLACFPSLGRVPMLIYVRLSNEITYNPSKLARSPFRDGG